MAEDLELLCKPKTLSKDKTNPTDGSSVQVQIKSFMINVFFDGTWNNMENNNIYRGLKYEYDKDPLIAYEQKKHFKFSPDESKKSEINTHDYLSYHREGTTIEWLYNGFEPKDDNSAGNIAVYVEGTGTLDKDTDGAFAAGSGWGPERGFDAKAQRAFNYIAKKLETKGKQGVEFDLLQINIYGFSRGAASARYFSNLIRESYEDIKTGKARYMIERFGFDTSIQPCQVQIGFIGIFDTVVSIGLKQDNDAKEWKQEITQPNPGGDVPEPPKSYKVVHIAASNEARTFFSLYDIHSSMEKGYGVEFRIPGCHTDIGGGLGVGEELVDGEVVIAGKNEVVRYVREHHQGEAKPQERNHFNSEGDHDVGKFWLFDNVLTRLLRQKINASKVDASLLAQALIDEGYYEQSEYISDANRLPDYKANLEGSRLYLIDDKYDTKEIITSGIPTRTVIDRTLWGYRQQLNSGYPRVSCHLMYAFIKKYDVDYFMGFLDYKESQIPDGFLQEVLDEFKGVALAHDDACVTKGKGEIKVIKPSDKEKSRKLFKNYLHWSGNGEWMDAQIFQWGEAVRTVHHG
ncbi:DUF2235 domain-containing protein [Sulfuricurvum sp.]|uniref:phospholipase effector Tle1 domain-containing protein n=1 Tax=Sulfuricurvum sp. TaxID=2025608 RepID=UPI0026215035|nr:DUF2235 domain-containing protein [Sulfuricurvum sp.]MDD2782337.1 DUF2235 domain-containing protein [Sulfuricurvum sp.]